MKKPTEDLVNLQFNCKSLNVFEMLDTCDESKVLSEPVFWKAPFEDALKICGDYAKYILTNVEKRLLNDKKYVFVDFKIQKINEGNTPAELSGCWWHVDAPILVPSIYSKRLGFESLIDIAASRDRESPRMFSFLSTKHCATQYIENSISITLPKCIESFKILSNLTDEKIKTGEALVYSQQPNCWVEYDSSSLHRAVRADKNCLRVWCRVAETNYLPVDRVLPINTTFAIDSEVLKRENNNG